MRLSIETLLKENQDIVNVKCCKDTTTRGCHYQYIFECGLVLDSDVCSILIAVPDIWQLNLIDIYVEDKDFPFVPHVDAKGKICMFELEGSLIDADLAGILYQSIERAKKILNQGIKKQNQEDFIREFELYWCQLRNSVITKLIVPDEDKVQILKLNIVTKKRGKGKLIVTYVSENQKDLECWKVPQGTLLNCLYIPLNADTLVLPPDPRNELEISYVNDLLELANYKEISRLVNKLGKDKVLIFALTQLSGLTNYFGVTIKKGLIKNQDGKYFIAEATNILPLKIKRIDKTYLLSRTSEYDHFIKNKKILVIGGGSIGGFIVEALVKAGAENLTLVDDDILKEENIFRHLLGMRFVGMYKVVALAQHVQENIPNLKIITHAEKIENAIRDDEIELSSYDLIISATGNHNVNLWLNQYVFENSIQVPVLYAWNEIYGIGNHVAYIHPNNNGCYNCFFSRDEKEVLYDRNVFCAQGQQTLKTQGTCGNVFVPYGVTISQKTAIMCMELIANVFRGRYDDNIIVSSKGDSQYFEEQGLCVSEKYLNQSKDTVEHRGIHIKNGKCNICSRLYNN